MNSTSLPDEVYSYWDELPIIIELDVEMHKKINKNQLRDYIIKAISKGVVEKVDGANVRRHALTVNEMIEVIQDMFDEKTKKSNVYYHLQVLIDLGIVQEVASIKEGNIITTYFGRTSKLVMMNLGKETREEEGAEEKVKTDGLEHQPDFKVFLERMQKKHDTDVNIDKLMEQMKVERQAMHTHEQKFKGWISEHATELRGLDIDLIKIFYLYIELHQIHDQKQAVLEKLETVLQANQK